MATHEEVFGELHKDTFSLVEAAEYLEITEEELYAHWLDEEIDAELCFKVKDLKDFKKVLKS